MTDLLKAVPALFLCWAATVATAQDGVSTAGAARSKYLAEHGGLPAPSEVVVEDFVNYHRHEIARPKSGEAVALDLRWGSAGIQPRGSAVLQVGLSTALTHDRKNLRPVNLSLVIDKSGSMSAADKLTRVKQALDKLVAQLRPTDMLSLVCFDSEAQLLMPATTVGDGSRARSLIRSLEPGSSTNIEGGLKLGYEQALSHYDLTWSNRVVLLTDGIANVGVTEPALIAKESVDYNERGIDLSTIGVGMDLNRDMLRELAKKGRGLAHFVGDDGDIEKVFVKELQSLLSPVAKDPKLVVRFDPRLTLDQFYGYEPQISEDEVTVPLDTMNSGMTEVVLMRFHLVSRLPKGTRLPVSSVLTYYDEEHGREVQVKQSAQLVVDDRASVKIDDESVRKNYTIAELAQSIHEMAVRCEANRYAPAEMALDTAILDTNLRYPSLEDEDIVRTLKVAKAYKKTLEERNKGARAELEGSGNASEVRDLLSTERFTSPVLAFTPATENCLWPAAYTIAQRFDQPQLHRLVSAQPFAAPEGGDVYFANCGGTETMEVLQAKVDCKPNTNYRISLQAISLTPGREWIPTFEIRVNGHRSEPRPAGELSYEKIETVWNSGAARTATIRVMRMAIPHGGGVIGLANWRIVPVTE
ncbi:MAG: VWA domain-containing protein [Armatimonadetes bacterium]|nr:VWA domain-containing protein [Armatimonadota bacterium]